ncbi:hypothetical protein CVT26_004157 [Gymnopilus dilepis]|uniref:Alpha-type protein kinase domain-containing protein n=1 Tax=Gymnopilus dilepis TaxID=231916 RepID=A0A409WPW3_9AGAR|nr:hypothetical protein CVT26_004157 [Gymnopilus dilepis]
MFTVRKPASTVVTELLDELLPVAEQTFSTIPEDRRPCLSFSTLSDLEVNVVSSTGQVQIKNRSTCESLGSLLRRHHGTEATSKSVMLLRKLALSFIAREKDPARTVITRAKRRHRKPLSLSSDDVKMFKKYALNSASYPMAPAAKKMRLTSDDVKVISHPTASFAAFVTEPGDQLLDEPEEDSFPSNFQSFQFRRIDYEVEDEGSVHEVVDDTLETIQVPTGWLSYAKANLGHPQAGYLAKGLYKYAFKARIGGRVYAIFQSKALFSSSGVNEDDLRAELKTLRLAEHYMERFYGRIRKAGFEDLIPGEDDSTSYCHAACGTKVDLTPTEMIWNAEGAFVGEIVPRLKTFGMEAESANACLIFNHFLAAPLLPISELGHQEIRLLGNLDIENHECGIKAVINAFLHAALEDSKGRFLFADIQGKFTFRLLTLCSSLLYNNLRDDFPKQYIALFDPQVHTPRGTYGHWDVGRRQIEAFLKKHRCNQYCRFVDLEETSRFDRRQLDLHATSEFS